MDQHIQAFLDDLERSGKAKSTVTNREADLRQFDEYLDENDIAVLNAEPWDIHTWLRHQSADYSPGTVRSRYDSVKLLYDQLAGLRDLMDESPVEELSRAEYASSNETLKHNDEGLSYATPEEIDALCEHVPDPKFRNELIIRLFFQTGMRQSELIRVKLDNIRWENHSIRIYAPKTDDWRVVRYQPSLEFTLRTWIDQYRPSFKPAAGSPYLFVTRKSERLTDQHPNRIVRKAAENAGIQDDMYEDAEGRTRHKVTSHYLRHGHAVHALKSGIDIRSVAGQLGHKKIETTMQYLQYIDSDVEEAYEDWQEN